MIDRQLSNQWLDYEDEQKLNSRNRMHIPSLEGMYQTLSKLQEIIQTQVFKLGGIKKRIGMKENLKTIQSAKKGDK
jgi:nuclear pore complex protein Nup214